MMKPSLRAIVLGAAAGGGLPQWNCACDNCRAARDPASGIPAQTQSSIAVSADGEAWAVLNASPDIRHQLTATAPLHPRSLRDSPVRSVLLTNGDIDHIAGLLVLRESQPLVIHATAHILGLIETNSVFRALNRDFVELRDIALDRPFTLLDGLEAELFATPGKVPLYMEEGDVRTDLEGETTVGVRLTAGDATAFYIPGCARMTPALAERLSGADLVFFDGTVFHDDEMIRTGTGIKTGARMGHMAMSGEAGSMAAFEPLGVKRRVYIHINNTNPVWNPASPERSAVEAAGWDIAMDGKEYTA